MPRFLWYTYYSDKPLTERSGDFMDIAGLSMAMSTAKTNDSYGVAMLAKTLDQAEVTGSQVVDMMDAAAMERSVNPHIGGNFDMTV